jgi:outer membrane receptor protein involved in Fe transport
MKMNSSVRSSLYAVLVAGLASSSVARAENNVDAEPAPEIIVFGRAIDLIGITSAGSSGVVGYRDFDLRPILRTGEMLETIPGLIATQHSGEGKANQYFLRGFNLDHGTDFATFVDGVPANMRSHGHGQGYTDLNFIIPELVERIDYRKGPYHADVGDFSAAGTAAFKTWDRLAAPIAEVTVGQFGYVRAVAAGSVDLGAGAVLAGGSATLDNGPWVLDSNLQQYSGLLKYSQGSGDQRFAIQAGGYDGRWNATDQVPERAIASGLIDRFGFIDPDLGGKATRLWLSADGQFGGTRFNAYAVDSKFKLTSNFAYFLDDPVDGDQFQQVDRRQLYGGALSHSWAVSPALMLKLGSDMRYDDIGTVGLYRSVAGVQSRIVREDQVKQFSIAGFAEAEVALTPRLRAIGGLRVDHFGYDVSSSIAVNSGTGTQDIVSPKFALAWRATDDVELYANYGGGYHSNDARGAAIRVDPNTLDTADPVDLLVRARGAEIGARLASGAFNATLVGFWLGLDSELLFVGDGGTTEPNAASRRFGVEFAGFWRPSEALVVDLSAAWTDARFSDVAAGENRIPGAVPFVLAGGVTWHLTEALATTVRLRHLGPAPLIEDNSVSSDATTLVNLGGYYTWGRVRFGIDIYNLFDTKAPDISYFYASRLSGEPANGIEDRHLHPAEPRQVRATVKVSF